MLVLKSLTFQNIGRFVEPQTINFSDLGSLVQVDAKNINTGGSSGAGKSTIFKALDFLLGLNDVSTTILQSRLTKDTIQVTGLFELDDIPLKIERGKKLSIDLGGEVTTGSSKLTEEKLDQIIGMPGYLFRKVMHKRQGEGGFFLDMGPSEVHKFLTSCLGLDKEQEKVIILDSTLSKLTEQERALLSDIESQKTGLEATQTALALIGLPPILDFDLNAVDMLKSQHELAIIKLELSKTIYKQELEQLESTRPKIETAPFDRSKIEAIEQEILLIQSDISKYEKLELSRQSLAKSKINELQIMIRDIQAKEQTRQAEVQSKQNLNSLAILKFRAESVEGGKAKDAATKLAAELQKIRASTCPTCTQSWANDATKAKESEVLAQLQEHKKAVIAGVKADKELLALEEERKQLELDRKPQLAPELAPISTQIQQLKLESEPQAIPEVLELKLRIDFKSKELLTLRQEEKEHQFTENAKQQLILVNFESKRTLLRNKHDSIIKLNQDEERDVLSQYQAAKAKVKAFEEALSRFNLSLDKLTSQLLGYSEQLASKQSELALVQEELELAQEAKKAIKSYLSCSFEDALEGIGETATKLVRGIPNMSTCTIQFEGLKETKEGKVKEEVTCLISVDGEQAVPVKSLSGGERSSVDLGIDLAVIQFIEERTGKGIDLMILDEPFTGLDSQCCEDAIEMLKGCTTGKRIFLVDHNPQVSQTIENRLTVVRDGLTSKIVQQ